MEESLPVSFVLLNLNPGDSPENPMIIIGVRSARSGHGHDRDRSLSDHGEYQAQTLKQKLITELGYDPDMVFVSAAYRSHQTASIIMRHRYLIPTEIKELYAHPDREKNETLVEMFSVLPDAAWNKYEERFRKDAMIIDHMATLAASRIEFYVKHRESVGQQTRCILICGHAGILPMVMYKLFPSPFFKTIAVKHAEAFVVDTCQGDVDNVRHILPSHLGPQKPPLVQVRAHH